MVQTKDSSVDLQPINNYGRYRQHEPSAARRSPAGARSGAARRHEEPVGRYDGRTARMPATGLARAPASHTILARLDRQIAEAEKDAADLRKKIGYGGLGNPEALRLEAKVQELRRRRDGLGRHDDTVGAIADPWGTSNGGPGTVRDFATINRRVDVLEMERSHKLISESAYNAGRQVQALLERVGKVKSVDWAGASRGDPALANEMKKIMLVATAKEVLALQGRIQGRIGVYDMRLLRRVVGDRMSYADCAALEGKGGERGQSYVATRFRDALEQLAEIFDGKGASRPVPDDAYKAAAVDVGQRQVAAIAGGVTRERYEVELGELQDELATTTSFRQQARLKAEIERLRRRLALMPARDSAGDPSGDLGEEDVEDEAFDYADPD